MSSGIYCIENIVNGKKYIGQSQNMEKRQYVHFSMLFNNKHENSKLQRAFNKYGKESFVFKILIYCEIAELTKYEQDFVNLYKDNIYNIRLECVETNRGIKWSEESKLKASLNHADYSGKNHPRYGTHCSDETKKKISEGQYFHGENHPMYGKHHSEETKRKISEARRGTIISDETKQKMSGRIPWNKGMNKIEMENMLIQKDMEKNGTRRVI